MKVKVKCPKCRLTYPTEASAGETELACVCPRCGTPFTYSLNDTIVNVDPQSAGQGMTPPPIPHVSESQPTMDEQKPQVVTPQIPHTERTHRSQTVPPPVPPVVPPLNVKLNDQSIKQPKRHNGCCFTGCLIILVLFALAAFGLYYEYGIRANSYNNPITHHIFESEDEEDSTDQDLMPSVVERENGKKDEIPSWLEGMWYAQEGNKEIVLSIHRDQITVKENEELKSGTFYYKTPILHLKFDDADHLFRVEESDKAIYSESGTKFIKE